MAVTRSYNRWLIDIWKQAPERLRWVAVLPLLSMDKALEEARFAKENGACGIFIRGLEGRQAAAAIPIFFRSTRKPAGSICRFACIRPPAVLPCMIILLDECGFNRFKLAVVGSFHSLIFNKIPEKFPKTKWAFIEVSSQWVPYAIHDFARRYERSGTKVDKSRGVAQKQDLGRLPDR